MSRVLGTLFCFVIPIIMVNGQYKITGQLPDSLNNFSRVILEYLPPLQDLNSMVMDNFVNEAMVDSSGKFELSGIGLPEEKSLYRILLTDLGDGAGIYVGGAKNFIIVALSNNSLIKVSECRNNTYDFSGCKVEGDEDSQAIQKVYDNILSKINSERSKQLENDSKRKEEFIESKYENDLKTFADTSSSLMASLVALSNLKNVEVSYKKDVQFFGDFISKWEKSDNNYFERFKNQIQLFKTLHTEEDLESKFPAWLLYALTLLLILSLVYNLFLRNKLRQLTTSQTSSDAKTKKLESLSKKEREVLNLITQDLSNKEIASKLFVETSTVKSHITKIYQKLNVSSRKELINSLKGEL